MCVDDENAISTKPFLLIAQDTQKFTGTQHKLGVAFWYLERKWLVKMSAISSGVSAVARRLPVAMETLCGMLRDFERVVNTDQRRD